jgi:hypothetical protein
MDDGEDFDRRSANAISHDVGRTRNYKFTCASATAWSPFVRKIKESFDRLEDYFSLVVCCCRTVLGDVFV